MQSNPNIEAKKLHTLQKEARFMNEQKRNTARLFMMFIGILFIGLGVASYRMSGFGTDPFTCMNLGISGFISMSFGTWQLIMNAFIFILVFFTVRHCIGLGTIVNMVGVGYIADFLCWLLEKQLMLQMTMPSRIFFLALGTLFCSSGCALYMVADLGIAPYDSVAFIITKFTQEKISFRVARVMSDVCVMVVGVAFCLMARNSLWEIIGIGTVVNALCNGPLIQFFRGKIEAVMK